jgi:hypothetical protein
VKRGKNKQAKVASAQHLWTEAVNNLGRPRPLGLPRSHRPMGRQEPDRVALPHEGGSSVADSLARVLDFVNRQSERILGHVEIQRHGIARHRVDVGTSAHFAEHAGKLGHTDHPPTVIPHDLNSVHVHRRHHSLPSFPSRDFRILRASRSLISPCRGTVTRSPSSSQSSWFDPSRTRRQSRPASSAPRAISRSSSPRLILSWSSAPLIPDLSWIQDPV